MKLKTPQVRVLQALVDALLEGRDALGRAELNAACGWTKESGTLTRALHGLREGSSSGAAHAGLLTLGWVEAVELDVDGRAEVMWRVTDVGREGLAQVEDVRVTSRSKAASINHRYRKEQIDAEDRP